MGDMTIPFIMLLILTIGLLLDRKQHEDKVVEVYEDKFEEWKEHYSGGDEVEKQKCPKELVGLVFLEEEKLNIELLDPKVEDRLDRKKYTVKSI